MQVRGDNRVSLAAQEIDLVNQIHVKFERYPEESSRGTTDHLRVEGAHGATTKNHAVGTKAEARAE